jgi:hypothetical protein
VWGLWQEKIALLQQNDLYLPAQSSERTATIVSRKKSDGGLAGGAVLSIGLLADVSVLAAHRRIFAGQDLFFK